MAFSYKDIDVRRAADTIKHVYSLANDDELTDGRSWYRRANEFLTELAEQHGRSLAQTAGVFAALSVGNRLEKNEIDAARVLERPQEDTKVHTYRRQLLKALAILDGAHPLDELGKLKTAAFWTNIVNPDRAGRVTIDRHAIRAADLSLSAADVATGTYAKTPKKYEQWENAYKLAAGEIGILPHELQAVVWLTFRRIFVAKQWQQRSKSAI